MHRRLSAVLVKESFLGDAIRKGKSTEAIGARAAAVYSWLACVGRHSDISIQSALEAKFPSACPYCGHPQCVCEDATRGEAILPEYADEATPRSLRGWQHHLDNMYGENNRAEDKGPWFTVFRLMDESAEMMILELNKGQDDLDTETLRREMQLELADATAWLLATCSLTGVDLQKAVLTKYGNGCVKCNQMPCRCGMHYFDADAARELD